MINIGQYIETVINWMMVHFSTFFDAINAGIGSFIIGFQHVLFGIPFYITILVLAALAWMKAGRGTAIFTALGLLLIYGMGFWEATMQTLALVFSSTCLALIVGVPLGVWTANSPRAEKILRPVLDLMQTMPAFATDTVCCSMASRRTCFSFPILSNSSMQQSPPSLRTSAPASKQDSFVVSL